MMHAANGVLTPNTLPMSHVHDALFDHMSYQMAVPPASRTSSRGLTSQQRPGPAMRVHKPRSANSPRSSVAMHRRRTMGVVEPGRQRQAVDFFMLPKGSEAALPARQEESFRPLSWHASSYLQLQQQQSQREQFSGYPFPTPSMYADSQLCFSPMLGSYSNQASPCSMFSPPPVFPNGDSAPFVATEGWGLSQKATPLYTPSFDGHGSLEAFPALVEPTNQRTTGGTGWESLPLHEYHSTSPPTPETYPYVQCPQPAVSDQAASYEVANETEEEGEILVGMGLYDAPDKVEEDPQLNNYRSTVTSLLGPSLRPLEPRGKGLKLEETWEPPKAEDDSEQDSDSDEPGSSAEESAR